MQNSQGEHLEPPQLSRLLDWLTQASPAILIRPQASATTTEPGPNGKDAEMGEWICEIALASTSGGRSVPLAFHPAHAWDQPGSQSSITPLS